MTDSSNQPTPGRRVASVVARGPDITVVLAVLLPLLTVGTLLLVRPDVARRRGPAARAHGSDPVDDRLPERRRRRPT